MKKGDFDGSVKFETHRQIPFPVSSVNRVSPTKPHVTAGSLVLGTGHTAMAHLGK